MSNDFGDIFRCDRVAKSCTYVSKINGDMENIEPRNDNMVNIHLLKYFSCLGSNILEAFLDQQSANLLSCTFPRKSLTTLGRENVGLEMKMPGEAHLCVYHIP